MKNILTAIILFLFPVFVGAQTLTGIASRYSDSFVEWLFYTEMDKEEGDLKMRWQLQNDWTEWEYRLEDAFGTVKLKWRDNPNEWELRGDNEIVSARTLWNDDFREWRITDNSVTLTLKTKWGNQWDEWEIQDSRHGDFLMFTAYDRDPREWNIEEDLSEEVSFPMKMMLMFIVAYHSSPKQ